MTFRKDGARMKTKRIRSIRFYGTNVSQCRLWEPHKTNRIWEEEKGMRNAEWIN